MDEKSGILTILALIVVLLGLIGILKSIINGMRNPFIIEIEEWLKTKNPKFKNYFELDFPKKYPEFREWKENREKK